jgi:hypothetical protein
MHTVREHKVPTRYQHNCDPREKIIVTRGRILSGLGIKPEEDGEVVYTWVKWLTERRINDEMMVEEIARAAGCTEDLIRCDLHRFSISPIERSKISRIMAREEILLRLKIKLEDRSVKAIEKAWRELLEENNDLSNRALGVKLKTTEYIIYCDRLRYGLHKKPPKRKHPPKPNANYPDKISPLKEMHRFEYCYKNKCTLYDGCLFFHTIFQNEDDKPFFFYEKTKGTCATQSPVYSKKDLAEFVVMLFQKSRMKLETAAANLHKFVFGEEPASKEKGREWFTQYMRLEKII